ncbi:uncharacterized protein BcabD6B2_14850 [Babesia caballi]|uniref:CBS domain-containing protein n=1 Tax=Babesia caballi TaxID=5871 RepID=A0AAV4LQ75_BABCB|nr:hypothetical protein, conserved [Babesia caballi]
MKAASQLLQVLAGRVGGSSPAPTSDTATCSLAVDKNDIACRDIDYLLTFTPVLVVDSAVPFYVCLQAMAEYGQEFALVYNASVLDFVGCFDELSFLQVLVPGNHASMRDSCGGYFMSHPSPGICKVAEDCSAKEALQHLLNQRVKRVFVWSSKKDAPIGFLTTRCFVDYITKHLRGCRQHGGQRIEHVSSSPDLPSVPEDATLRDISVLLSDNDEIPISDSQGHFVGILNRKMIVHYVLSRLRQEVKHGESRSTSAIVRGGVRIPVLTIANDAEDRSIIQFEGASLYTLGVDTLGNFAISSGDQPMLVVDNEQNISIHMQKLSVRSVDFGGDLVVEGVSQFKMIWREDFADARGWNGTGQLAGVRCGYCLSGHGRRFLLRRDSNARRLQTFWQGTCIVFMYIFCVGLGAKDLY